jgi:hypothetical protein
MKYLIKVLSFVAFITLSQLVLAGEITDSFADGDTLTAGSLNNAKDAINDNDARITALEATYVIGDTGPAGGWVFYVDADGRHGLEAAPTDQSGNWFWRNNFASTDTAARGDGLGAGEMNTMLIIANQGSPPAPPEIYAAGICADLVVTSAGFDYGDWYLPSKYELNLMYLNIGQGSPLLGNVGGFITSTYWSSTERNRFEAESQQFSSGSVGDTNKASALNVRAVRAF